MTTDQSPYLHEALGGQCKPGDIAPYVLVPGSQRRVQKFAEMWDTSRRIAQHYEFLTYSGTMGEVPVTACCTGIGGRSVGVAVDEMAALGGNTFIRVGVSGPLQPQLKTGDLIIATAGVRLDGPGEQYVRLEYPAVASFEVVAALVAAAQKFDYPYHVGIGGSSSSFYLGASMPGFNGYIHSIVEQITPDMKAARVLDWDTETATLFTLCGLYGLRAGRVNAISDDVSTGLYNPIGEERAMRTALEAIRILAAWDAEKARTGARFVLPPYPFAD